MKLSDITPEQRAAIVRVANAALVDIRRAPKIKVDGDVAMIDSDAMSYKAGVLGLMSVFGLDAPVRCYRCWISDRGQVISAPCVLAKDAIRLLVCVPDETA